MYLSTDLFPSPAALEVLEDDPRVLLLVPGDPEGRRPLGPPVLLFHYLRLDLNLKTRLFNSKDIHFQCVYLLNQFSWVMMYRRSRGDGIT